MIGSGVFDRHPKLQVLIVQLGGGLTSIVGRLDFDWQLNDKGVRNPPAGRPYTNKRLPSEYFKTNMLADQSGHPCLSGACFGCTDQTAGSSSLSDSAAPAVACTLPGL